MANYAPVLSINKPTSSAKYLFSVEAYDYDTGALPKLAGVTQPAVYIFNNSGQLQYFEHSVTEVPVISITSPLAGNFNAPFTMTGTAVDEVDPIVSVRVYVDQGGTIFQWPMSLVSGNNYSGTIDPTVLSKGYHNFVLEAKDNKDYTSTTYVSLFAGLPNVILTQDVQSATRTNNGTTYQYTLDITGINGSSWELTEGPTSAYLTGSTPTSVTLVDEFPASYEPIYREYRVVYSDAGYSVNRLFKVTVNQTTIHATTEVDPTFITHTWNEVHLSPGGILQVDVTPSVLFDGLPTNMYETVYTVSPPAGLPQPTATANYVDVGGGHVYNYALTSSFDTKEPFTINFNESSPTEGPYSLHVRGNITSPYFSGNAEEVLLPVQITAFVCSCDTEGMCAPHLQCSPHNGTVCSVNDPVYCPSDAVGCTPHNPCSTEGCNPNVQCQTESCGMNCSAHSTTCTSNDICPTNTDTGQGEVKILWPISVSGDITNGPYSYDETLASFLINDIVTTFTTDASMTPLESGTDTKSAIFSFANGPFPETVTDPKLIIVYEANGDGSGLVYGGFPPAPIGSGSALISAQYSTNGVDWSTETLLAHWTGVTHGAVAKTAITINIPGSIPLDSLQVRITEEVSETGAGFAVIYSCLIYSLYLDCGVV